MGEFKLELQSWNAQFGSKSAIFCPVWPWNLMDDLEKNKGTSSKQHQALCIISSAYLNSNWSYGPERAKWVHDLWPWPLTLTLTFCMDMMLSMVITPENFRMMRWQEHSRWGIKMPNCGANAQFMSNGTSNWQHFDQNGARSRQVSLFGAE